MEINPPSTQYVLPVRPPPVLPVVQKGLECRQTATITILIVGIKLPLLQCVRPDREVSHENHIRSYS